jgi:hypothetical protein
MLMVSLRAADPYEQETRRMFVEWKARVKETYRYVGEDECRYAVFKETRRRVARGRAAGVTSPGLNSFSATTIEEFNNMFGARMGEKSYEQETRRMFVGWKAKYGKTGGSAGTGCSRATAVSSSGSTPPPGKMCTASTNSATSPTRRSANAATRRWRTES